MFVACKENGSMVLRSNSVGNTNNFLCITNNLLVAYQQALTKKSLARIVIPCCCFLRNYKQMLRKVLSLRLLSTVRKCVVFITSLSVFGRSKSSDYEKCDTTTDISLKWRRFSLLDKKIANNNKILGKYCKSNSLYDLHLEECESESCPTPGKVLRPFTLRCNCPKAFQTHSCKNVMRTGSQFKKNEKKKESFAQLQECERPSYLSYCKTVGSLL